MTRICLSLSLYFVSLFDFKSFVIRVSLFFFFLLWVCLWFLWVFLGAGNEGQWYIGWVARGALYD